MTFQEARKNSLALAVLLCSTLLIKTASSEIAPLSSNCVGSNSEDFSLAEFVPCPTDSPSSSMSGSPSSKTKARNFPVDNTKFGCIINGDERVKTNLVVEQMSFTYSIETSTDMSNTILSDMEKTILSSLDESALDCSSLYSRKLEELQKLSGLVSVDTKPNDKISNNFCAKTLTDAEECSVIEAKMTLFFTSNEKSLIQEAKVVLLKSILNSMKDDQFVAGNILKVSYLGPAIIETIDGRSTPKNPREESSDNMDTVFIAMGSTIFVAGFAYLVRRRVLCSKSTGESDDMSINEDVDVPEQV